MLNARMMRRPAFVLACNILRAAANLRLPQFSWKTVPVFAHSCNMSAYWTQPAIETLARYPMVTIEKAHAVYASPPEADAEAKIVRDLLRVKAINPNVTAILYYNSVLDWPYYELHQQFAEREASGEQLWLRSSDGTLCEMHGDSSFPNSSSLRVFDMANPRAVDLWIEACLNATSAGIDGCFSDRATGNPNTCTLSDPEAYEAGHAKAHNELQTRLGADKLLIANEACTLDDHRDDDSGRELHVRGAMLEFFEPSEQSILALSDCQTRIDVVQARFQVDDSKQCQVEPTDALAAFLIAAGPFAYFACSEGWSTQTDVLEWHEWYDLPLGEPLADAVKTGSLWTRSFASGTNVTFNVTSNSGTIDWATMKRRHQKHRNPLLEPA